MKRKILTLMVFPIRLLTAISYIYNHVVLIGRWLFQSREHTNYTYNLTDLNVRYMANFLAVVTGRSVDEIEGYIREILKDDQLYRHIVLHTKKSDRNFLADDLPRYARRIGWYALTRATRPSVIIETGVDKGLGSCVLSAALMKNSLEGSPGIYYGTDVNPKAGYLFTDPYNKFGHILYGDSIESLSKLDVRVDLFINDSDHSTDYEMREFEAVEAKLSEKALVIGDNAHFSDKLIDFARKTNRNFLFFQEQPKGHWYPGSGIGVAYR